MTTKPADAIADHALNALLGTLDMNLAQGMALAKVFAKYRGDPIARAQAIDTFARDLAARCPDVAGRLVDALASHVGR